MIDFKPFTSSDWMGLAGAENFPDGSEPLIAWFKMDGFDASAVIDAHGLTVSVDAPIQEENEFGETITHEETEQIDYIWTDPSRALRAAPLLNPEMTEAELLALNPQVSP